MEEQSFKRYWMKFHDRFLDKHEIKLLLLEDRDYVFFYMVMLLESISHAGNVRYDESRPYTLSELSLMLQMPSDKVKLCMEKLKLANLLVEKEDGTLFFPKAPAMCGYGSDSARRMRKLREKRKNASNSLSNENINIPNVRTSANKCEHVRTSCNKCEQSDAGDRQFDEMSSGDNVIGYGSTRNLVVKDNVHSHTCKIDNKSERQSMSADNDGKVSDKQEKSTISKLIKTSSKTGVRTCAHMCEHVVTCDGNIEYKSIEDNSGGGGDTRTRMRKDNIMYPKTWDEVEAYLDEQEYIIADYDGIRAKFMYLTEHGWKDVTGKQIKNWKLFFGRIADKQVIAEAERYDNGEIRKAQ